MEHGRERGEVWEPLPASPLEGSREANPRPLTAAKTARDFGHATKPSAARVVSVQIWVFLIFRIQFGVFLGTPRYV